MHDDIYEALRACVVALGGAKRVGARLWPEMEPTKAGNRLNDCLNQSKRDVLNPEQVLLILKRSRSANCHVGMDFIASWCQYETPKPIEPDDEMARLQRRFIQAVGELNEMSAQYNRMVRLREVIND